MVIHLVHVVAAIKDDFCMSSISFSYIVMVLVLTILFVNFLIVPPAKTVLVTDFEAPVGQSVAPSSQYCKVTGRVDICDGMVKVW